MPKRIYYPSNKRIYRYREDGNFYMRLGTSEVCLETTVAELALSNLKVQDSLTKRFGAKAYKFKLPDLFPEFLKSKKKEVRERTYNLYESIWRVYFETYFAKTKIGDVNQRLWLSFCDEARGVSDFQNHRNLMHQFLKWCEMNGFVDAIPTLQNPKHKRRKRKVIPAQHLALIFQNSRGRLLLFNSLALFMGMRRSEIMKLPWSRVDLVNRTLTLSDEAVKTDEGRELPINSLVHSLLVKHLEEQQTEGINTPWVFPNSQAPRRPAGTESLMTAWRTCLLHSGFAQKVPGNSKRIPYKIVVEYTWHDFRATFEKYAHKSLEHTDTQREKFAGAAIDVQKRIYVSMTAEDLRGLEEVVSNQVPELARIVSHKTSVVKVECGNEVGEKNRLKSSRGIK